MDVIECRTGAQVPVGSVSHGTLKASDLAMAALGTLELVNPGGFIVWIHEHRDFVGWFWPTRQQELRDGVFEAYGWQWRSLHDALESLNDEIDAVLPDEFYYGAHPSDGADIGVWRIDE